VCIIHRPHGNGSVVSVIIPPVTKITINTITYYSVNGYFLTLWCRIFSEKFIITQFFKE
jgi:hypothetical protein